MDLLVFSLMALLLGIGIPVFSFGRAPEPQDAWTTLTIGGEALHTQIGWTLTLYVTVLLGFFAVAIGGQIFGGPAEATRLRRTLGAIGLLLAASSVPLLVYVTCYCLSSGQDWAGLIVLLPVNALIIYLALHVGRFIVFDQESRLLALDDGIRRRAKRILYLEERSSGSNRRGLPAISVAIAATTLLPVALGGKSDWWGFLAALVLLSLLSLAINLLGWLVLRDAFMDLSATWSATWITYVTFFGLLAVTFTVSVFNGGELHSGIATAIFGAGCLLVIATPRKWQSEWMLNLSVNGWAAASAFEKLKVKQQDAEMARDDLISELMPEPEPPLTLWERLLATRRNLPVG